MYNIVYLHNQLGVIENIKKTGDIPFPLKVNDIVVYNNRYYKIYDIKTIHDLFLNRFIYVCYIEDTTLEDDFVNIINLQ